MNRINKRIVCIDSSSVSNAISNFFCFNKSKTTRDAKATKTPRVIQMTIFIPVEESSSFLTLMNAAHEYESNVETENLSEDVK